MQPLLQNNSILADLPFVTYTERQVQEIKDTVVQLWAGRAKKAGKFVYQNGGWSPIDYKGFAVISMLCDCPENDGLGMRLTAIQQNLASAFTYPGILYQLPAESFHQTVANTFSEDRFQKNIVDACLEAEYPRMVEAAFQQIEAYDGGSLLQMKLIGLSIFGTAIGILGVFEDERHYQKITHFRKHFYNNKGLAAIGLKMTRPFIGHVTLSYIEAGLDEEQQKKLALKVQEINHVLAGEVNIFYMRSTSLRSYSHLAAFEKEYGYPTYYF